ncbi:MAG: squalene/phytoene synthase family protein, partial [Halanaerobiales bacterium]
YLSREVKTFIDLDEYCYYVAGTVGGFLTDLIIYYSSITEEKSKTLLANFNASGQFLQKINLIRDIREDVKDRVKHFWPLLSLQISLEELMDESKKERGLEALARMLADVKTHIPNLIHYYLAIPEELPGYRKFYSLNNALGLATIEEMDNNPAVLYGPERVKVDKLSFLKIMKNPEKAFLERAWPYYLV